MTLPLPAEAAGVRAEILPLIRLSLPLMIGLAAATLIGVVDTVMIAPLGTLPLAAAGITTAVLIILISALWGVVTVVSVRIATTEGAGDRAGVAAELRTGLALALIVGVVSALIMVAVFPLLGPAGQPAEVVAILFPYWLSMALWLVPFLAFFTLKSLFDAVGKEWIAVALSYLGVLVNIPANYLLIHVAGVGLVGAGLASILSQSVSLIAALAYWRAAAAMAPYRAASPVGVVRVGRLWRDAMPLCLGYAAEGGAYAFVGVMLGWLGATALAAHQVVGAAGSVAYMIPLGLAGAASIRVGHAVGQDQTARLRAILVAALSITVAWQAAVTALFVFGGQSMAAALSNDPAVIAVATLMFIAVAVLQIADGIQATSLGALRGLMDNTAPTVITLLAYWPLALPAAYLFAFVLDFGVLGVWAGYTLGVAIAAVALPWRFWRQTAPR